MKRYLILLFFLFIYQHNVKSQCIPDWSFTSFNIPGVYPPAINIPAIPFPTGIAQGYVNSQYNQTLTLVVLEDTVMDISPLLQSIGMGSVVTALNQAGIPTVMSLYVNHVNFNVVGLPNGINANCDNTNCTYPNSDNGCIQLSGSPMIPGNFQVNVDATINVQIPAILNPLPGFPPLFSGADVDIPTFSMNQYDLIINENTNINNQINEYISFEEIDNIFHVKTQYPMSIKMFNSLGKTIYFNEKQSQYTISSNKIPRGMYFINIYDNNLSYHRRIIIK